MDTASYRKQRTPILPSSSSRKKGAASKKYSMQQDDDILKIGINQDENQDIIKQAQQLNGRLCRINQMYLSPQSQQIHNGIKIHPLHAYGHLNSLLNQNAIFISNDQILYISGRYLVLWDIIKAQMKFQTVTPSKTAAFITSLQAHHDKEQGLIFALAQKSRPKFNQIQTNAAYLSVNNNANRYSSSKSVLRSQKITEENEQYQDDDDEDSLETYKKLEYSKEADDTSSQLKTFSQTQSEEQDGDWHIILRVYRYDKKQWTSLQYTYADPYECAIIKQIGFLNSCPLHCFTVHSIQYQNQPVIKFCFFNFHRKVVLFQQVLPSQSHIVVPFPDKDRILVVGNKLLFYHDIKKHGFSKRVDLLTSSGQDSNSPNGVNLVDQLKSILDNDFIDAKFVMQSTIKERRKKEVKKNGVVFSYKFEQVEIPHYFLVVVSRENSVLIFETQSQMFKVKDGQAKYDLVLRLKFLFRAEFTLKDHLKFPDTQDEDVDPQTLKDFKSTFPQYQKRYKCAVLDTLENTDSEQSIKEKYNQNIQYQQEQPSISSIVGTKTGFLIGSDTGGMVSVYEIKKSFDGLTNEGLLSTYTERAQPVVEQSATNPFKIQPIIQNSQNTDLEEISETMEELEQNAVEHNSRRVSIPLHRIIPEQDPRIVINQRSVSALQSLEQKLSHIN